MAALIVIVALAAAPVAEPPFSPTSYDLPAGKSAPAPDQRIRSAAAPATTLELPTGPAWTYRSKRGPVVEVAALGGVIRDVPALAHVAFNWTF